MAGRKVFTSGEILTAADVNSFLMDQSVMVFDDATDRATAIPTPVEGMVTYLKDTDRLEQFDGTNFVVAAPPQTGVLQVVSTTKTDIFSTSSSTFADITDLSVSITPSSATSKMFVSYSYESSAIETTNQGMSRLLRDSTPIAIGDAAGSRTQTTTGMRAASTTAQTQASSAEFLDSPNTTSSVTYKVQVRCSVNGQTLFISRPTDGNDTPNFSRSIATITVMEVAG